MAPHYNFHIFICTNKRPEGHHRGCCFEKESDKILSYMKMRVKELGIKQSRAFLI